MSKSKKCEACGKTFYAKEGDYGKRWAGRKFCSRGCRNSVYTVERPLAERFWEKVDKSGGPKACWPWTASTDTCGYGRMWTGVRLDGANRIVWELINGPIPKGKGYHGTCVLHKCDNPKCCNPAHLFLGSNKDNLKDMTAKGRHGMRKLADRDVITIRKLANQYTQRRLAEMFHISVGMVSLIVNRKNWTHI